MKLAGQLSVAEIRKLLTLKAGVGKRLAKVQKQRDKLAAQLAKVDASLARLGGDKAGQEAKPVN